MTPKIHLKQLELLVREGEFQQVQTVFRKLNLKTILRTEGLAMADIARRVGLHTVALRILNPIVRRKTQPASPTEQALYAEVLRKLGAINEAKSILQKIDGKAHPQVFLYLAGCSVSQWNYAEAIPLFKAYLESKKIDPYQKLVGQINLAAALIQEENWEKAATELALLRAECISSGHHLLHGQSLELSAHLEINNKNYSQARKLLDEASHLLAKAGLFGQLWVRKWRAISESLETNTVTIELRDAARIAGETGQWETLRDCTFYIASIERNSHLMTQVFYGTPYEAYRNKILRRTTEWYKIPDSYTHSESPKVTRVIDIATAQTDQGQEIVPFGKVQHRLLIFLARDLFRPTPLIELSAKLFPDEYFNPESSPARVHQAVRRLRKILKDSKAGLRIVETDGVYHLATEGATGFTIPPVEPVQDFRELQFEQIFGQVPLEFSVHDILRTTGCSLSSAKRLLRWAIEKNKIEVIGGGRKRRYRSINRHSEQKRSLPRKST